VGAEDESGHDLTTARLAAALYDELRALAWTYLSKEPDGHTLQPTALVNEALLRMLNQRHGHGESSSAFEGSPASMWQNREQFLGVAAICMRRVLVDHARMRGRVKRSGGARIGLDESMALVQAQQTDLLDLDAALTEFSVSFPRQARVVELRSFAGLELERIGDICGISLAQVKRDWVFARAWLKARLDRENSAAELQPPEVAEAPDAKKRPSGHEP
jgi:RNA polymerase sigma factor (TIGR02999 family)